jgi:hypothetical protein
MSTVLLLAMMAGVSEDRLFVDLDVGLPGRPATAVAISPVNSRSMLAAVDGLLFRSTDGGETWHVVMRTTAQTVLPLETELEVDDVAEEAAEDAPADGAEISEQVFDADALPEEFEAALDDAEVEAAVEEIEEDLQESLMAEREGGVDTSLPEGDQEVGSEQRMVFPRELPGIRRVRFVDEHVVYVATHRGVYRSVDRGETYLPLLLPRHGKLRDVRDVAWMEGAPMHLVVATAGGTLQSRDGGGTWERVPGPAGRAPGLSLATAGGAKPTLYVGTRYGLVWSVDGGVTFQAAALAGARVQAVLSVAVNEAGNHVYAVTPTMLHRGGLGATVLFPVGALWRDGLSVVHAERGQAHVLWAGGKRGVYVSKDAGQSALELSEESMVRDVADVAVARMDPSLVLLATATGVRAHLALNERSGVPGPRSRLMRVIAREPSVLEVANWAVEVRGINPAVTAKMGTRARLSWLGPTLMVQGGISGWVGQARLRTGSSTEEVRRADVANPYVLAVAGWQLDRLVMAPSESTVLREHRRLLKERDRVWARTLSLYEARRRVQAELVVGGSRNVMGLALKRVRLQELTSALDAQTGGRFTLEARLRGAPWDGVGLDVDAIGGRKP